MTKRTYFWVVSRLLPFCAVGSYSLLLRKLETTAAERAVIVAIARRHLERRGGLQIVQSDAERRREFVEGPLGSSVEGPLA